MNYHEEEQRIREAGERARRTLRELIDAMLAAEFQAERYGDAGLWRTDASFGLSKKVKKSAD